MKATYHIETTMQAIGHNFAPIALQEIIRANLSQDSIGNFFWGEPYLHFCNDQMTESLAYIESEYALIESLAALKVTPATLSDVRAAFGRLLHTAQDFYSHSNYVTLWLEENLGGGEVVPRAIDGLDESLLNHPKLRTAHWLIWRDSLYYLPLLGALLRRIWVAPNSHESMHLDSPERGALFAFSLVMAQQRTVCEYRRVIDTLSKVGGSSLVKRFHASF